MTIHRPGLPEDLPAPDVLWARWSTIAIVTAEDDESRGRYPTGCWLDSRVALRLDDSGCTWWTLVRYDGGRAVLYGEDESSAVKWHEPPVDMLAGGPDWLPYENLRDLLEGYELGCVYWYESGSWARAPYPDDLDDDGLDCGMGRFADREKAVDELVGYLDWAIDHATADALMTHAEQGTLTRQVLDAFLTELAGSEGAEEPEGAAAPQGDGRRGGASPAMAEALRRSGLDTGAVRA
ncbi:hypothetical protein [Streptomyces sp. NPDC088400]|uniref:hypothetical protein n=1 Tax=Streptomyces sp. NPDC088400 TaxID=3365861 RepID=UPI00382AA34F